MRSYGESMAKGGGLELVFVKGVTPGRLAMLPPVDVPTSRGI